MNLMMELTKVLSIQGKSFRTLNDLKKETVSQREIALSTLGELRVAVKSMGYTRLKPVVHSQETDSIKNARISFFVKYVEILQTPKVKVLYFDWSSFSSNNFQQKVWSVRGRRAVVDDE